MKKSHKRLLILELFLLLVFFLNSFVYNFLNNYNILVFLIIIIFIFNIFLGLERDRHRQAKAIILEFSILILLFFFLYYLLGIIIGFAKTGNYLTFDGLKNFIFPIFCYTVLKEYLRYEILIKCENNKIILVLSCIIFIFLEMTNSIYYFDSSSRYNILVFIGLSFLPAVSNNIVCSYLSPKIGYKPLIYYSLILSLYSYIIPIVPDSNEYLSSVIKFLFPVLLGYRAYLVLKKQEDEETIDSREKSYSGTCLFATFVIIIITVYFTSGYFHYHAVAVASGSMQPNIYKGDVAIVEKINEDYKQLKKGQIIAYEYNNKIIVHRLVKIIEDNGKYYFYTKGDANQKQDNYVINENMVIGVVNHKIPYIGMPTVWFNSL
ncbi:MAG: signal peptidase I [Bacilli bacterium]